MRKGEEFKVQVHHIKGIDVWEEVIDMIQEQLLCDPDDLLTLCKDCHEEQE